MIRTLVLGTYTIKVGRENSKHGHRFVFHLPSGMDGMQFQSLKDKYGEELDKVKSELIKGNYEK